MIQDALDFENIVESAIAALLAGAGLAVFTTGQVPDFQKDRPRVQVQYTHGPGRQQWANPNKLPDDLKGQKIETAWASTLHTTIVTAADENGKAQQSELRSLVRLIYMNLAPQINGNLLTGHRFNIVKESGSARSIHPNDSNTEVLQLVHEVQLSLHESVWSDYVRITDYGTIRTGFTRIVSGGTAATSIFKNITDLNTATVVNGNDVLEVVHAGENVQVTVDTLSSAIGGGGGGQVMAYSGPYPSAPPSNTNNPAIAYSADGSASTWYWNVVGQTWM